MTDGGRRLPAKLMRRMRGITLIELMVVVVIIGLVAVFAYPNYREFAARANRNEAKAALLRIATNQERFYLQNNTYGTLSQLGYAGNTIETDTGSYDVTITPPPDANNFRAVATFKLGGAEAGKCSEFTVDGRGAQTSQPKADCWTTAR